MKISAHILSVYLLLLAFIPCGDGGNSIVELAYDLFGIEHVHKSDHEQHSNTCEDDFCSPLCICSCCSISLNTPEKLPVKIHLPTVLTENSPTFLGVIIPSSFLETIWQPPRIGQSIFMGHLCPEVYNF
jgi:hypothetical protein